MRCALISFLSSLQWRIWGMQLQGKKRRAGDLAWLGLRGRVLTCFAEWKL